MEPVATNQSPTTGPELDARVFAAMSYLSVLFIVPWVVKRDDAFVMFHVKQGVALFVAEVVVWFVLWLLESLLVALFSFGAFTFAAFLYKLAWIFFAVVSVMWVYWAARGIKRPMPWLWIISKNLKI